MELFNAIQNPGNMGDVALVAASLAEKFFANGTDSKVKIAVIPNTENCAKELGIGEDQVVIVGHRDLVKNGREIVSADKITLPASSTGVEAIQGFQISGDGGLACASLKIGTVGDAEDKNAEITQKCAGIFQAYIAGRGMEMRPVFIATA